MKTTVDEQVFTEQVFTEQVFTEQVFTEQVFTEQVFTEQVFTEQVLKSIAFIQKRDCINYEIAKITSGIGSILGVIACGAVNISINIEGNAISVEDKGGISGEYPGDIQIAQHEDNKEIKTALEIAKKEIFEREEGSCITVGNKRKIKNIIIDALCPSLLKTSDDVFEIAKSSTPVLLTLSLSGTISLPIQPVFFAAAAIMLARSSIAAICKDRNQSSSK